MKWDCLLQGVAVEVPALEEISREIRMGGEDVNQIMQAWTTYWKSDASFLKVQEILATSTDENLVFMAAIRLREAIKEKWLSFNIEYHNELAQTIQKLIEYSMNHNFSPAILTKADECLVEIAKYDWPQNDPNFLSDIIASSSSGSPQLLANGIRLVRILIEEVDEFVGNTMTTIRHAEAHDAIIANIQAINSLIEMGMGSTPECVDETIGLLRVVVKTISRMDDISFDFVLNALESLLPNPRFCIQAIGILSDMPMLVVRDSSFHRAFPKLLSIIVSSLRQIFPDSPNFLDEPSVSADTVKSFIGNISPFICTSIQCVQMEECQADSIQLFTWIFIMTQNGDIDMFKSSLDIWNSLVRDIYWSLICNGSQYNGFFGPIFPALRRILIRRMGKPNEVVFYIDENDVILPQSGESEKNSHQQTMRDTLIFLTHINPEDMINAIFELIEEIKSKGFNIPLMNSLCWSAGSISGSLGEDEERGFIPKLLEYLLPLCKSLTSDIERASVASGVLYVCSQYGTFLSRYWEFLKAIMAKLLEFLSDPLQSVQDSAMYSIKCIAAHSPAKLATVQSNEEQSFLEYLIENRDAISNGLSPENIVSLYEVIATLITQTAADESKRGKLLSSITNDLNREIQAYSESGIANHSGLDITLRCYAKLVQYVDNGPENGAQIVPAILNLYTIYSNAIKTNLKSPEEKLLRYNLSLILKLLGFMRKVGVRSSLDVIIPDFESSKPEECAPEVVQYFADVIPTSADIFKEPGFSGLYSIYKKCYLLIQNGFDQFAIPMLSMLRELFNYSSQGLISLEAENIKEMVEHIQYLCGNPNSDISDAAISAMSTLFISVDQKVNCSKITQWFQDNFTVPTLINSMTLLVDNQHSFVYSSLVSLERTLMDEPIMGSKIGELIDQLHVVFPTKSANELYTFASQMKELSGKFIQFIDLITNFLVHAKHYSPMDPALYEEQRKEAQKKLDEQRSSVKGLLPPNEPQNQEQADQVSSLASVIASFSIRN